MTDLDVLMLKVAVNKLPKRQQSALAKFAILAQQAGPTLADLLKVRVPTGVGAEAGGGKRVGELTLAVPPGGRVQADWPKSLCNVKLAVTQVALTVQIIGCYI